MLRQSGKGDLAVIDSAEDQNSDREIELSCLGIARLVLTSHVLSVVIERSLLRNRPSSQTWSPPDNHLAKRNQSIQNADDVGVVDIGQMVDV